MYVYEGLAYDLLAAAVGAAIGVAVAFGMVFVLSSALGAEGITIEHDVQLQSVVVAYTVGVLLTFVVVVVSAWRVSRLNIVTAIRNLPEPPARKRLKRRWIGGLVAMTLGALLTLQGVNSAQAVAVHPRHLDVRDRARAGQPGRRSAAKDRVHERRTRNRRPLPPARAAGSTRSPEPICSRTSRSSSSEAS